jgi:lysyl-tRNA synthetase class 1
LEKFAPENVKFEVQLDLPKISLTDDQQKFITELHKRLSDSNWDSDTIHNTIYDVTSELEHKPRKSFEAIYNLILGKPKGPRLGYFLSTLDRDFVLNRFSEI